MLKYRNIIVCFFFAIYIILGLYLSITNGISHDQYHEQLNWKINFQAIKSVLFNQGDYQILLDYIDRYHGIAFHYISQPIQLLSNSFKCACTFAHRETSPLGLYNSRYIFIRK